MRIAVGLVSRGLGHEGRELGRCSALLGLLVCLLLAAPATAAAGGPRNLEAPQVETAGHPEVGESLSCYPGTWEGSGVTFAYEWKRENVPFVSGQVHQITAADEGHWLSCAVTATDSEGVTEASSKDSFFINSPGKRPRGGTVEGHVTDALTGNPVGGVKVCAEKTDEAGPWECVHTAASGQYAVTVAEAGKYIVELFAPARSGYVAITFYNGKYSKSEADVLTVASGSKTSGIDAQLREGGRIEGTVTSAATGKPVEEVEVCAREAPSECALTNSRGEYTISGLATGSYIVEFGFGYGGSLGEEYVAPEYYKGLVFTNPANANTVAVTAGTTVNGIDAQMHQWGQLSGRVTSASTHAPISGIQVDAYDEGTHSAVTNANGEYTITHLGSRSDDYEVSFRPSPGSGLDYFPQWYSGKEHEQESERVHISLDHTTSGINAELVEAGQITGRVTDATTKAPISEITVCARSKIVYEGRCAWTNANGEYAIVGLPSDEYTVSFYTNSNTYFPQERGKVVVAVGHDTSGLNVELDKVVGGAITGYVSDKSSARALEGIEVCAYEVSGKELPTEELFAKCATTTAGGLYWITGLTGNKYIVEFYAPHGSGLNYATQYYDERADPLYAQLVEVNQGSYTAGIGARLEVAGKISGKATSAATGKPIKGIEVCVSTRGEELVGCLLTNSSGEYLTPPVARGEYKIEFRSPSDSELNYVAQYYNDVSDWNNAQEVKVAAEATTTGINADMAEGGRIAGQVTNAWTSGAVAGALVCAVGRYVEIVACASTNATGSYTIAGLASGEYKVAFAREGYSPQYYDAASSLSGAQAVSVTVGATHAGVDAALTPTNATLPYNTSSPSITGKPAVKELLSCSNGSWGGNPAPTYSYTWLRNGTPVTPPSAEHTYTIQKADEGARIECEVTARNVAGEQNAFSPPLYVPWEQEPHPTAPGVPTAPPSEHTITSSESHGTTTTSGGTTTTSTAAQGSPVPIPTASISSTGAAVTHSASGHVVVLDVGEFVRCPAGVSPCQIIVEVQAVPDRHGRSRPSGGEKSRKRTLIGRETLTTAAGTVETVSLELNTTGMALLHQLEYLEASAIVKVYYGGNRSVTATRGITIRLPRSRRHAP